MLRSCRLLASVLGGVLVSALPLQAATVQVASHIAFATPGGASTQNDISFGSVNAFSNAGIRISSFGQVYLDNHGPLQAGYGQAGNIVFNSPINQIMNFFSTNYRTSHNVTPVKATCSVNGARDSDCNRLAEVINQSSTKLSIGMQVIIGGNMQVMGLATPSFDLCVVYQ